MLRLVGKGGDRCCLGRIGCVPFALMAIVFVFHLVSFRCINYLVGCRHGKFEMLLLDVCDRLLLLIHVDSTYEVRYNGIRVHLSLQNDSASLIGTYSKSRFDGLPIDLSMRDDSVGQRGFYSVLDFPVLWEHMSVYFYSWRTGAIVYRDVDSLYNGEGSLFFTITDTTIFVGLDDGYIDSLLIYFYKSYISNLSVFRLDTSCSVRVQVDGIVCRRCIPHFPCFGVRCSVYFEEACARINLNGEKIFRLRCRYIF